MQTVQSARFQIKEKQSIRTTVLCSLFVNQRKSGNLFMRTRDPDSSIKPGTKPEEFTDDWGCPICGSDKTHLKLI